MPYQIYIDGKPHLKPKQTYNAARGVVNRIKQYDIALGFKRVYTIKPVVKLKKPFGGILQD